MVDAFAGLASASATAEDVHGDVLVDAGEASATAVAEDPTADSTALPSFVGLANAVARAFDVTSDQRSGNAGAAEGTAVAYGPTFRRSENPNAGLASATATANAVGSAGVQITGLYGLADAQGYVDSLKRVASVGSADPSVFTASLNADIEVRAAVNIPATWIQPRAQLAVAVTTPQPAIIAGQPVLPTTWAIVPSAATESDTAYLVTKPVPPIVNIGTRPPSTGGAGLRAFRWASEDLAGDARIATWPEHSGGPPFSSHGRYRPVLESRSLLTSAGSYVVYDKVAVFNYQDVQHMYADLGDNFGNPFTWVMAAIILSYPSARYGHYLIDQGSTPSNRDLATYGFNSALGQTSHRSAMLFQRTSAIASTTYKIEGNPMARCEHNYTPQPRMFFGVFNNAASRVGVWGRNYRRDAGGTVQAATQRRFVMGRRANYTSTDLASHLAVFETRFYPKALSQAELEAEYQNLASLYDFTRYPI